MATSRLSPIEDTNFESCLTSKPLNFCSTLDGRGVYEGVHYVDIATPTNCDHERDCFNISFIEVVMRDFITIKPYGTKSIECALPVSYTEKTQRFRGSKNLIGVD